MCVWVFECTACDLYNARRYSRILAPPIPSGHMRGRPRFTRSPIMLPPSALPSIVFLLLLGQLGPSFSSLPTTFSPEQLFASLEEPPSPDPTLPLPDRLRDHLDSVDPIVLQQALLQLGYPHASLGTKQHVPPPANPKQHAPAPNPHSITATTTDDQTGYYCRTHVQPHYITLPSGATLPSEYTVFVEEDNSITAHVNNKDGTGKGDPVECSCDEFDCTCQKQCFCKTQSQPFPTHQPAACPICKTCDGGAPIPPDDEEEAPKEDGKPNPAPHEFKCSCSFDGAGGVKSGSGGGKGSGAMDCDCKVSDCSCTRKCKCRAK
jgi:hypothetical protein